jgi:hypothetical protein
MVFGFVHVLQKYLNFYHIFKGFVFFKLFVGGGGGGWWRHYGEKTSLSTSLSQLIHIGQFPHL